MIVTQIQTHVADATARLLHQYKLPGILGLFAALVAPFQQLENAAFAVDSQQQLANAQGAQLDGIGNLVGAQRNGMTDAQYLAVIRGTIAENNSDSTTPTILRFLAEITGAQNVWLGLPTTASTSPSPPRASVQVGLGGSTLASNLYPLLVSLLGNALGAGIAVSDVVTYPAAGAFALDGPQSWVGAGLDYGALGSLVYSDGGR